MDKQLQAAKSVKMEQKNTGSFIWKFHYFPLSLFSCFTTWVFYHFFLQCFEWDRVAGLCENSGRRGKFASVCMPRTVLITGLVER